MMKKSHSKGRKSKLRKTVYRDKEDRISHLPDSILCHILSFLPTKYAVATSVLSSRWRLVWTSLLNLNFDDRLCIEYKRTHELTHDASTRFENFVNRVFVLSHLVNINKFSLYCFKLRYFACLKSWVSSAIMRNVREIELNLKDQDRVELPDSIYTCKTLEVLKLYSDFNIKIPRSGICFPSVKILHVVIRYPDNNLTERLFSICPMLEDLSIEGYLKDDYDDLAINFNISSSTLKRLKIDIAKDGEHRYNEHTVIINAPNLERLFVDDVVIVCYTVHELHLLTKVSIDVSYGGNGEILADRVLQLLKGITKAKFLCLGDGAMSALDHAYENFFPIFSNLTYLDVAVGEFGWRVLPVILNCSPNLETFVFLSCSSKTGTFGYDEEGHFGLMEDKNFGWIEPQFVPLCLILHVKKIEIWGFVGQKDELGVVKYLLKNSEVLDKMIIRSNRSNETASKENLCQKLLMFQRASKTCKVEFR